MGISVGASYEDRGVRRNCHDFFGVALSIPMSDKKPRGEKRQKVFAGGATQPAAQESASSKDTRPEPMPEDQEEKRVAKNRVAYGAGPMNALTGRVMPRAERILEDMYAWYETYAWYEAPVDVDDDVPAVFRHLQNTLFQNVTVPLPEDQWKHLDVGDASQPAAQGDVGGVSQPAAQGGARLVVSREHVARQVQTVIACREKWLRDQGLPLDTMMRGDLADRFLEATKCEFHASAEQQEFQKKDAAYKKQIQPGKHSRWSRHIRKLGGTTQMWTLLSFTSRFDVTFLVDTIQRDRKSVV